MSLAFRNVEAQPTDDVGTWPYEALVTAMDRGLVPDWQPIFAEIRHSPWGATARRVEGYLEYRDPDGVGALFRLAIDHARAAMEARERSEVATRVRSAIARSGCTAEALARLVGTSPSRLSTYACGRVVPSATLLVRIEAAAERLGEARAIDEKTDAASG